MSLTTKQISEVIEEVGGGKYPLAKKWNEFVKKIEEGREIWTRLQEEIDIVGEKELESRYPVLAQKHLGRFRKVKFEWMISMFVDYYRGAGGLDAMYIILPPEKEEKKDE
uniref:Uncharacterized protein n=1 Tax=viral metagenome TaxID=1070528 RepID=A0A6H1ZD05_9ZZZZ